MDVHLTESAASLIDAGRVFPGAHVCESELHPLFQRLATEHARFQAAKCQQGHQQFYERLLEILRELGLLAVEICAESWPWQQDDSLLDLGKEMFHCWEQSPGHWKVASRKYRY